MLERRPIRIIHVRHTNGQEAVILTNRPNDIPAQYVAEDILGPLSPHNTVADWILQSPALHEWPLDLPTEQPLSPQPSHQRKRSPAYPY